MSRKDNIIRGQQNKIEQLEEQIKALENDLYKAKLAGIGVTAGVQEIIDQAARDMAAKEAEIDDLKKKHEEYVKTVGQLMPIELLAPPEVANSADEIFQPGNQQKLYSVDGDVKKALISRGHPVYELGSNCFVGVAIWIRHDNSNRTFYQRWQQPYPGTLEEITSEVFPRISALLARAPMREDFANAGIIIQPETQEKALIELSNYLYHFKMTDRSGLKWPQKVREVFERLVWPEINGLEAERREKGNAFLKIVNRSFDHMESSGRGLKTHEIRKSQRSKLGV